jgi:hypothetical protein
VAALCNAEGPGSSGAPAFIMPLAAPEETRKRRGRSLCPSSTGLSGNGHLADVPDLAKTYSSVRGGGRILSCLFVSAPGPPHYRPRCTSVLPVARPFALTEPLRSLYHRCVVRRRPWCDHDHSRCAGTLRTNGHQHFNPCALRTSFSHRVGALHATGLRPSCLARGRKGGGRLPLQIWRPTRSRI